MKDRFGSHIFKTCENVGLEEELSSLRGKHQQLLTDYKTAQDMIAELQNTLKVREDIIEELSLKYENAKNSAALLNKMVNDNRVKYEEEKLSIFKNHK